MDIQDYLENAVRAARAKTLANSDQLTLGEMILKVEHIISQREPEKDEAVVVYDFGYLFPTSIDSWRGSYCELALDYTGYKEDARPMKASQFLNLLKESIGKEFTGYKGGEFVMNKNTPVWVSNYGESCHTAIVEVVNDGYQIILATGYREF